MIAHSRSESCAQAQGAEPQVADLTNWKTIVARYAEPDLRKSLWQVANTLLPYLLLWPLMLWSLHYNYLLTLALILPAAGLLVRLFVIGHDCGHYSFFKNKHWNDLLGPPLSLLVLTPYHSWRYTHAMHHANAGDLDQRGVGDIWTLTVSEYLALGKWGRLGYRLYRNPLIMFGFGSFFLFLIWYRLPRPSANARERRSVMRTNLALAVYIALFCWLLGWQALLLIQLPIWFIGAAAGSWLFYVQHQFEGVYWDRHEHWDFVREAMEGSSYYKLPAVLQWFSANIGFHHIHHLSPRIPNYQLERCHRENPLFQRAPEITLLTSLKSLKFRLWDEQNRRLIGFGELQVSNE